MLLIFNLVILIFGLDLGCSGRENKTLHCVFMFRNPQKHFFETTIEGSQEGGCYFILRTYTQVFVELWNRGI